MTSDEDRTTTLWEALNSTLYADLDPTNYFGAPPLLAHYTSIPTFEAIVKNNEIWFSNPLFMNDIEEVRWGIRAGTEAYLWNDDIHSVLGDHQAEVFRNFLSECVTRFETTHAFDTYILCLSEHDPADEDGLLSMWRGYGDGGRGVALVFDGSPMKEVSESPLIVSKVEYMTTDERLGWFARQGKAFASKLNDLRPTDAELQVAAHVLFGRLRLASLFSKHVGFGEEREWRIAYMPERDPAGLLSSYRGYHVTPRGVEPKLKLKIEPLIGAVDNAVSLEALIKIVLLGPTLQAPLLHQSVRRMLELMGKATLAERVRASRIPYRPTGLQF